MSKTTTTVRTTRSKKFDSLVSFFEKKDSTQPVFQKEEKVTKRIPKLSIMKKVSSIVIPGGFDGNASTTSTTIDDFNNSFNDSLSCFNIDYNNNNHHSQYVLNETTSDTRQQPTTNTTRTSTSTSTAATTTSSTNTNTNTTTTNTTDTLTLNDLKFCKIIGEGQFGQVWLASIEKKNKDTTQVQSKDQSAVVVAVKVLAKCNMLNDIDNLINEVSILKEISNNIHPCLAQMYNTIQDENLIYIIQEFYAGGDMFSLVQNNNNTNQKDTISKNCKFYSACVCDAIHTLHTRNIIFRDIKLENIMIHHTTGYPVLIDFGYAKHLPIVHVDEDTKCFTMVGTPKYVAPEIILGTGYNHQADLWSIGILIYELLVGYNPMEGNCTLDEIELYRCITEEDYIPIPSDIVDREPNVVSLIDQLLQRNPIDRIQSSNDIICHEWFTDINFINLRQQTIPAPWIPFNTNDDDTTLVDSNNTHYFDNWDYIENDPELCIFKSKYPKLTIKQQEKFNQL